MHVVIAAGGTGGHLYPAIALAREFVRQRPDTELVFVGTSRGLETKVLAHEGFPLVLISAQPFMGVGMWGALRGLLALPRGLWQSVNLLSRRKADLVISVGGYTSPAVVLAACLLRTARVLLEPNAYPGMANKALSPLADRVFLAFESAAAHVRSSMVRVVGSPIREEFVGAAAAVVEPIGSERPLLLIFGGSQGARAINQAVVEAVPRLAALKDRVTIVHQTGEADQPRVQEAYASVGYRATVVPFLYDLPRWLRQAALVVSRSGAMTVAELTACGRAAVLVPLPQAIYDHQMKNARVLETAGAAVVIPQGELTGERLASTITALLSDPKRLREMSEKSQSLGRTDAGRVIVTECIELVERKRSGVKSEKSGGRGKRKL